MRVFTAPAVVVLSLLAGAAAAQVPDRMAFQGRLSRADGQPETATLGLRFAIYDAATGGTRLWEEVHPSVEVVNGYYSVTLGTVSQAPLSSVFNGAPRFLAVSLENQSELSPRLPLSTMPHAFVSNDATKLGGRPASEYARDTHAHPVATTSADGFLSSADKTKLDAVPTVWGNGLSSSTSGTGVTRVDVAYAGTGSATTVARSDHSHSLSCATRTASAAFNVGATATCQSGEEVTGGGCDNIPSGAGFTITSAPTANGYACKGNGTTVPTSQVTASAICCKLVP